jgi:uncharacterized protein YuzE
MAGRKVWAADEILAANDLQSYIQDQVVFVYANASARASGILSPTEGMVSYLLDTDLLYTFNSSSWVEVAPNVGTAGTYTKVTTDAKGRVSSGTTLSASDIPSLDASKVTSGTFTSSQIPSLDASKINSGTIAVAVNTTGGVTAATLSATSASLSANLNCAGIDTFNLNSLNGNWYVYTGGSAYFAGQIRSPGSRATLGGSWNALYVDASGNFGIPPSTERVKQDIDIASIDTQAVLGLRIVNFRYIKDVETLGDDAPIQLGLIAEEVEEAIGSDFVYYDDEGKVAGIHFERLAFALIPVLQSQAARLDSVEDRLSRLEK